MLLKLKHYLGFIEPIEISRQQAIWLDVLSIIGLIVLNAMLGNYFFMTCKSRILSEGRSLKARTRELEKHNRTLERNTLSLMDSVKKISHDINAGLNGIVPIVDLARKVPDGYLFTGEMYRILRITNLLRFIIDVIQNRLI